MASSLHRLLGGKQDRKLRKPLIERKRRERINNCLDKLKETVVGAFRLDQSKLEKADILEMTVKHLQNIQGSKMTDSSDGPEDQQKYSTGYIQCMHEVHNLLLTCEWMDKTLGARMLNHLLKSLPKSSEEAKQDPAQPSEPTLPLPVLEDSLDSAREDKVDLAASPGVPCTTTATRLGMESPHLPAPSSACPSLPSASSQYNGSLGAQDLWRPW